MPKSSAVRRFGEKLRLLRTWHSLSTQALARQLDTSSGYISLVENGQREPRAEFVFRVAQLFNVSADVLLNDALELTPPDAPPT